MPVSFTEEQVLALAPDDSSKKAGKGLAAARHWVTLGHSETVAWGECKGSASMPYQTQIDLGEPAFKCTCPSRKFPCKHGLGLFLMLVGQSGSFSQTETPEWVAKWLETRANREEKKAQKAAEPPKPVDAAAQAKRAE